MNKIISLDEKLKLTAREKAAATRKRKILAVRKMYQCVHCPAKCERCGTSLGPESQAAGPNHIPYHFCDSCAEEYQAFISRLHGQGDAVAYWHNEAWLDVWQAWIAYQGAIGTYLRSREFQRLLKELRTDEEDA